MPAHFVLLIAMLIAAGGVCAGQPSAGGEAPPKFTIQEHELERVAVPREGVFPWEDPARRKPDPKKPPESPAAEGMMDVSGGDVLIRTFGPFSREVKTVDKPGGGKEKKELLTLSKDVEIEQPRTGSVLRGQRIRLTRDLATGNMDSLEANGTVEIVMPGRSARGESLLFETRFGPNRELLMNRVSVMGDKDAKRPATVWAGKEDTIQAYKFVLDLRLDTFRALGGAVASIKIPVAEAPGAGKTAKPAAEKTPASGATGMMPGLALAGGGRIEVSCDGDLTYEGSSGRVRIARNVTVQQEGLKMGADEMALLLETDAAGAPADGGVFSGSLKSIEAAGRIEIVTAENVMQCDRLLYDLSKGIAQVEMNKPEDDVKIYGRDPLRPDRATQLLRAQHRILVETASGVIRDGTEVNPNTPAHRMRITPGIDIPIPRLRADRTAKPKTP